MNRSRFVIALFTCLGSCASEGGEIDVVFTIDGALPPEPSLFVRAWIADSDGAILRTVEPLRFIGDLSIDFGALPNHRAIAVYAEITNGRWKNSTVLFHGASEAFSLSPGARQTIEVLLAPGPWEKSDPIVAPSPPQIDKVVERRIPFGADETHGVEKYFLSGAEGAVVAHGRVVAFSAADVARASELGSTDADDAGRFELELDSVSVRAQNEIYVAVAGDQVLSDAANELDGLQAAKVEQLSLIVTPSNALAAPKLARVVRVERSLLQPNAEGANETELFNARSRDGQVLHVTAEPIWTKSDAQHGALTQRAGAAAAYDSKRGVVVLFGGGDFNRLLDSTWEWDGERWREQFPTGSQPIPRIETAMAYDAARDRTLLVAGYSGVPTFDTWEWDGTRWEDRTHASSLPLPAERFDHALVYDANRRRVLLFGGRRFSGTLLGDLDSWEGDHWEPIEIQGEAPSPRRSAGLAYDSSRRRVVLYGGLDASGLRSDTWELDGATWTKVQDGSPPGARQNGALVYDSLRERVVLFGGSDRARNILNDTWEWDGAVWTNREVENPQRRELPAFAYDELAGGTLIFGGQTLDTYLGDTRLFDGDRWIDRTQGAARGAPRARRGAASVTDESTRSLLLVGGTGPLGLHSDSWDRDRGWWVQRRLQTSPQVRRVSAAAFDAERGELVVYGGAHVQAAQIAAYDDTWTFGGVGWSRARAGGPGLRFGHTMTWNSAAKTVLLFGGFSPGRGFDDLWAWDGTAWSEVNTAHRPGTRGTTPLTYDPERGVAVLFGGSDVQGNALQFFNDTWEWDGDWHPRASDGPSPRDGHSMVAAPSLSGTVLFGGHFGETTVYGDTWVWNGVSWLPRTTAHHPHERAFASMIYDSQRGRVVLFGGVSNEGPHNDLWVFDGTDWTELTPSEPLPAPRYGPLVTYDARHDRIFVFGGQGSGAIEMNDLWVFDGTRWTELTPAEIEPPPRSQHALAYQASSESVLLFGGSRASGAPLGETWILHDFLWKSLPGDAPPARRGNAMSVDRNLDVLLFGGRGEAELLADTWRFDGTTWSAVDSAGPIARWRHALAFDAARGETVLYGGSDASGPLGDTWTFDGSAWAQQNALAPVAREGHAMSFNPITQRTVMFGGLSADALLGDTWEWTGSEWIERHPPPPRPEPRYEHALAYDPQTETMVLFGGTNTFSGDSVLDDTWELYSGGDHPTGAALDISLDALGIPRDRLESLAASANSNAAQSLMWNAWEGRWSSNEARSGADACAPFIDRQGTIHYLFASAPGEELELDYVEVTLSLRID